MKVILVLQREENLSQKIKRALNAVFSFWISQLWSFHDSPFPSPLFSSSLLSSSFLFFLLSLFHAPISLGDGVPRTSKLLSINKHSTISYILGLHLPNYCDLFHTWTLSFISIIKILKPTFGVQLWGWPERREGMPEWMFPVSEEWYFKHDYGAMGLGKVNKTEMQQMK